MAHDYCPYELVFGRTANLPIQFNSADTLDPLYNLDDYAKVFKFRLGLVHKRAKQMLDNDKIKQNI